MSGTNSPQGGLTRRSFLKTTGVAAGAAALAGGANLTALAAEDVAAQNASGEQVFRGNCRPNCFGFCHLNVHVRDGKIVKTSRAPYNNPEYSRICQRGLSHVQRVYDPDRVLYPMRRVEGTERGAGEWERVDWDSAITEIAEKMQSYKAEFGQQAVAIAAGSNVGFATTFNYTRFQYATNCTYISTPYDNASMYALSRTAAGSAWEANEHTDLKNSKHIVAWGANITDAQVHSWHFLKEAQQNGTKITVIDPTFTQIANKADLWIPIRPGSDTALVLGIMREFFKRDALNEEFLAAHTVAPFLVNPETGLFVRYSEINAEAAARKAEQEAAAQKAALAAMEAASSQGEVAAGMAYQSVLGAMAYDDQPVVVENGALVEADKATAPDLFAKYEVSGSVCDTALTLLRESVQEFTPERVRELTDVPEDLLYQLVDICLDQPVNHYVGYGSQAYSNGVHTTHAGLTMCGLIGNMGYPGASWGSQWQMYGGFNAMYLIGAGMATSPTVNSLALPEVMRTGEFQGSPCSIKMLYIHTSNIVACHPDTNAWLRDVVGNMEFIVTVDSMMTDTARYSDLVLPVTHWFEQVEVGPAGQTLCMNWNEKSIEPLGEAKTDVEIVHLIAEKLGMGDLFSADTEEIIDELLQSETSASLGITLDALKEKKEIRFVADEPHIAFRDGVFATPTGRLEFYLENPQVREATSKVPTKEEIDRERLPHWFPPAEAWPENELYQKYPLVCMSERPRFRVHSQWYNVPALRELDPEPIVKINPVDAEARDIENGMYVECYNDRGHAVARAVVSDAVRPGTLVYPKGWQRSQHKAGSWCELLSCDYDVFAVSANWMDTLCEIRPWDEGGVL